MSPEDLPDKLLTSGLSKVIVWQTREPSTILLSRFPRAYATLRHLLLLDS